MKIHCCGIGGIGLSAYASLQRLAGHTVSGSDRISSALTDDLASQGIRVTTNQIAAALPPDADLLVYSEAVPDDAPERALARSIGIPQASYPEALGTLASGYDVIAVCGTHGKSSTTAMAARMLVECGKDPTVVVGTKMKEFGGRNWRKGDSRIFLLEACEYRRSFLHYLPRTILLTTCDGDHFDYFHSPEDYRSAFVEFGLRLAGGTLITHMSDPLCADVAVAAKAEVVDADRFPLAELATPGRHMQQNAQLALALAATLDIEATEAERSLRGFDGTWRRMELKGFFRKNNPVIDDYGHHPAEIRATLSALREKYPEHRLICVFQPHTHDRTLKLYNDFLHAFGDAELVIIPNVYDAREHLETAAVNVDHLVADMKAAGVDAINGLSLRHTESLLRSTIVRSGDLLVCMGAGDITDLATSMVKN
ncbi:MAG: UDP-N-acetylmuramate--L-alanine ligase [Candidatus Peregrinibacteria bacterium Greene0416_19]|nr:MAG: UDP-N-acetylmuramate--L-alanine ligase [Candidatus Peregrinibacteria bacterium Greene0416_19]